MSSADHPWCQGDDHICLQLPGEGMADHPEWKEMLGDSGHFFFKVARMSYDNGVFDGELYTVNKDNTVTSDGTVFGKATLDENSIMTSCDLVIVGPEEKQMANLFATVVITEED